jgi:hypothetical protein
MWWLYGSFGTTPTIERQQGDKPSIFALLWSTEQARLDDVIDIDQIRVWAHDRLVFDAEYLDSEFDSNTGRYGRFRSVNVSGDVD